MHQETFGSNVVMSNSGGTSVLVPSKTTEVVNSKPRPLTYSQREERRQKGLCFYCDKKFVKGHECKKPQNFVMIAEEEISAEYEGEPKFDECLGARSENNSSSLRHENFETTAQVVDLKGWQMILGVEWLTQLGTRLHLSTAYHPQSDGSTERVNQCLEQYLRGMTSQNPKELASWLAPAEWWYNTPYHTTLNTTPYHIMYGNKPRHLAWLTRKHTNLNSLEEFMNAKQLQWSSLKDLLEAAQERMKQFSDAKRSERTFQAVGQHKGMQQLPHVSEQGVFELTSLRQLDTRQILRDAKQYSGVWGIGAVVYGVPELKNDQMLKISLRSIDNEDTTPISQKFGGGGHRNASSFMLRADSFEQWKICG
ncbi:hypothetical protein AgCh_011882 [Apium graveolens]